MTAPEYVEVGLILFTERYPQCVAFYRDVVGLAVLEAQPRLTDWGTTGLFLDPDCNCVELRNAFASY